MKTSTFINLIVMLLTSASVHIAGASLAIASSYSHLDATCAELLRDTEFAPHWQTWPENGPQFQRGQMLTIMLKISFAGKLIPVKELKQPSWVSDLDGTFFKELSVIQNGDWLTTIHATTEQFDRIRDRISKTYPGQIEYIKIDGRELKQDVPVLVPKSIVAMDLSQPDKALRDLDEILRFDAKFETIAIYAGHNIFMAIPWPKHLQPANELVRGANFKIESFLTTSQKVDIVPEPTLEIRENHLIVNHAGFDKLKTLGAIPANLRKLNSELIYKLIENLPKSAPCAEAVCVTPVVDVVSPDSTDPVVESSAVEESGELEEQSPLNEDDLEVTKLSPTKVDSTIKNLSKLTNINITSPSSLRKALIAAATVFATTAEARQSVKDLGQIEFGYGEKIDSDSRELQGGLISATRLISRFTVPDLENAEVSDKWLLRIFGELVSKTKLDAKATHFETEASETRAEDSAQAVSIDPTDMTFVDVNYQELIDGLKTAMWGSVTNKGSLEKGAIQVAQRLILAQGPEAAASKDHFSSLELSIRKMKLVPGDLDGVAFYPAKKAKLEKLLRTLAVVFPADLRLSLHTSEWPSRLLKTLNVSPTTSTQTPVDMSVSETVDTSPTKAVGMKSLATLLQPKAEPSQSEISLPDAPPVKFNLKDDHYQDFSRSIDLILNIQKNYRLGIPQVGDLRVKYMIYGTTENKASAYYKVGYVESEAASQSSTSLINQIVVKSINRVSGEFAMNFFKEVTAYHKIHNSYIRLEKPIPFNSTKMITQLEVMANVSVKIGMKHNISGSELKAILNSIGDNSYYMDGFVYHTYADYNGKRYRIAIVERETNRFFVKTVHPVQETQRF